MSAKIRLSYTDNAELERVQKLLEPIAYKVNVPDTVKGGKEP